MTEISRAETTVIGGGIVGLSVAVGLLKTGRRVTVLDGSDGDPRASMGNFGLVWLQGKGANYLPYADWGLKALTAWPDFAQWLTETTGIDPALDLSGGYEIFTEVDEYRDYAAALACQQAHLGDGFSHEVIDGDDLRRSIPGIGPKVVGATYSAMDGHVNPLLTLRALRRAVTQLGGTIRSNATVTAIAPQAGGGFDMSLGNHGVHRSDRVILCAGLGSADLTAALGFTTKIRPQRGELLITEKLATTLPFISSTIRQVNEGGIQIGGTSEDAGFDTSETVDKMTWLAAHAVDVYPALADVRVVRAWSALRVMTPDSYPVYARSHAFPGAFLVTCHSGVSLASVHGSVLADWIENTTNAPDLEAFDEHRFSISQTA